MFFTPLITGTILLSSSSSTTAAPNSDISISSGWHYTGSYVNPNNAFYDAIGESAYNDNDAIVSPPLGLTPGPIQFGLNNTLDAGTYSINVRARKTDTTGDIRVKLIDSAGNLVGTSSWQSLTLVYNTYALSVTITGTASRISLEVRA